MKKIFTLLLNSLFSLSLFAFDGSRLSISTIASGSQLKVEVDGRQFSMKDNTITLGYLTEGYHQVKIMRETNSSKFGKRGEVIYRSSIFLKKGYHLDITINRFGRALQDERRIDETDDWYHNEDDYYNSRNGGWNNGYSNVMNVAVFNNLKDQLRKEWFENNRMISVKHILDNNYVTTDQVRELMLLFTFENNRLEIAKYAYCKTVDQQNYVQLFNILTFSNSKNELDKFLREPH